MQGHVQVFVRLLHDQLQTGSVDLDLVALLSHSNPRSVVCSHGACVFNLFRPRLELHTSHLTTKIRAARACFCFYGKDMHAVAAGQVCGVNK